MLVQFNLSSKPYYKKLLKSISNKLQKFPSKIQTLLQTIHSNQNVNIVKKRLVLMLHCEYYTCKEHSEWHTLRKNDFLGVSDCYF